MLGWITSKLIIICFDNLYSVIYIQSCTTGVWNSDKKNVISFYMCDKFSSCEVDNTNDTEHIQTVV